MFRTGITYRALLCFVVGAFLILYILAVLAPPLFRYQLVRMTPPDWLNGSSDIEAKPTGFVVDTASCRIPDFDPFNPSILRYVRDSKRQLLACNLSLPITYTAGQYIRVNHTLTKSLGIQHCIYQTVRGSVV